MGVEECSRCGAAPARLEGSIYRAPLRVLCGTCTILAPDDNKIEERLAEYCQCETPPWAATGPSNAGIPCAGCGKHSVQPRPFQVDDARRVARYRAFLLGLAPGCGKTVVTILACLRAEAANFVFVPGSLKRNWEREIKKWRTDLRPVVADTVGKWRHAARRITPGQVVIGSYGCVPGLDCPGCLYRVRAEEAARTKNRWRKGSCTHEREAHPKWKDDKSEEPYHVLGLDKEGRPRVCGGCKKRNPIPEVPYPIVGVIDEAHAIKRPGSTRTKLWRGFALHVWQNGGYLFGLTGTPWENRPLEGWEVLVGLGLERSSFGDWNCFHSLFADAWFNVPKEERKPLQGEERSEFLVRMRRVRIFRRTRDCVKLPPRVLQDIQVDLSPRALTEVNEALQRMFATRRAWHDVLSGLLGDPFAKGLHEDEARRRLGLYDERAAHYFVQKPWDFDAEVVAAVEEVMTSKQRHRIADGPAKPLFEIRRLLELSKLAAIRQWADDCAEQEQPVVLFACHRATIEKFGSMPGWGMLHGGMSDNEKDEAVLKFQSGETRNGIAVSVKAGGVGITLVRSRICGFASLDFTPSKNQQAEARLFRIGAESHESILVNRFLSSHPVDKLVLQLLVQKEALLNSLEEDPET